MINPTCGSYGARDGKEVMKLMIHYVDITRHNIGVHKTRKGI